MQFNPYLTVNSLAFLYVQALINPASEIITVYDQHHIKQINYTP